LGAIKVKELVVINWKENFWNQENKPSKQGFIAEVEQGNYGEEAWGEAEVLNIWMSKYISGLATEDMGEIIRKRINQIPTNSIVVFLVKFTNFSNDDIYCILVLGEDFAYHYFYRGKKSAMEAWDIMERISIPRVNRDFPEVHLQLMSNLTDKFKRYAKQNGLYERLGKHKFVY
jgi:hypothetical protein